MHETMSRGFQLGLAGFYVICAALNFGFAQYYAPRNIKLKNWWAGIGFVFVLHALIYLFTGAAAPAKGPMVPEGIVDVTNNILNHIRGPIIYFVGSCIGFAALLYWRKPLTDPIVAIPILDVSLLVFGWAMTNADFRSIITKEDNVPIVMLIFAVGFFTWLGLRRAVLNDELTAQNKPVMEKDDEKVLVWPDLVYTELICMVIATAVLVVWSVALKAPLEQPATSAKAPNPSKAPWYFLGLQEMLVYFDPWMAGVVLPTMIIVGLIAIPYMDFNQKGNGYYTFKERVFSITSFLFGFLVLWVVLIVLGTFLRGPNWNFFAPFEYWDPHKVVPLNNVNLSDIFWLNILGDPTKLETGGGWLSGKSPLIRELPGILLTAAYMLALPPLLAKTFLRKFYIKMGFARFFLLVTLIQFMASLPIKMVLRWVINLKYIVYLPEVFFNI
jgi:hypothetical protein